MKHLIKRHLVTILLLSASSAYAGNVGVDLNIRVGDQPRQVIVREPPSQPPYQAPVVYQQPVVYQPPVQYIEVEEDINFIYPGSLGFYVAVGLPYDLFYVQNNYYLFRDGRWSRASRSQGPWVQMRQRDLPPGLRRHRIERIRQYRDQEYVVYRRDNDHYRGKHFRSGKEEWKEHRKVEKERRKEDKREEKEARKEDKREEKEARKEDKREEKHERKEHRGGKHDD